ncbi:hypothetical protein DYY67_1373 [Candidatus Nitrosotalea sp. TS]|nr:hypothetical protein [Candidatus Nitrosotalea sp. TS]
MIPRESPTDRFAYEKTGRDKTVSSSTISTMIPRPRLDKSSRQKLAICD